MNCPRCGDEIVWDFTYWPGPETVVIGDMRKTRPAPTPPVTFGCSCVGRPKMSPAHRRGRKGTL